MSMLSETQNAGDGETWPGQFSDGRTAQSRAVGVRIAPDGLRFGDGAGAALWPFDEIATAAPLTTGARDVLLFLRVMPAATLYVNDSAFAARLAAAAPQTTRAAFRRAGLRYGLPVGIAAAAIATTIVLLDLSPSKAIARLMPIEARERLGRSVLSSLPVTETCGNPDGRAALDALVVRLRPDLANRPHKVSVLNWQLVNAFAVPGGSVVLTRAIIEKAAGPDEIAGVLAHEMGHGLELHPEAGLVRSVGFWALVQMVFTGTPGAIGNVGSTLAQLAYSRGYEREADAIALKLLKDAGISPRGFAGFFRRMSGGRDERDGSRRQRPFSSDVLDTHPSTPERLAAIEGQPDYASTPALSAPQWQALKRICSGGRGGAIDVTGTDIAPVKRDADKRLADADAKVAASPSASSHAARGELHAQAGRSAAAVADYGRAIELEPQNATHRYNRGRALQNAERFDDALIDYAEALRLNPRYSSALAARGATFRLLNRGAEARRSLDEALVVNPRNEYALYQRGLLNAADNRWADSESDFARVLASTKGYALAHVRRAEALEKLRRRDEAVAAYRDALAASPSSADAVAAFARARERLAALGERP